MGFLKGPWESCTSILLQNKLVLVFPLLSSAFVYIAYFTLQHSCFASKARLRELILMSSGLSNLINFYYEMMGFVGERRAVDIVYLDR